MTLNVKFLKVLAFVGMGWLILGVGAALLNGDNTTSFLQVFYVTVLNLIFLILLYWSIFFGDASGRTKAIQILILSTFKLVCLMFLAITLRRFRNDPPYLWLLAVSFFWAGPLIAGIIFRKRYQE